MAQTHEHPFASLQIDRLARWLISRIRACFWSLLLLALGPFPFRLFDGTFSHRAERIANTLLSNIYRNGEAYVAKEIETRYAPEANDRFIRVTNSDGAVIYISGEPNDQSFDPKKVPRPPETHFVASTRIEHAGRNGLLIATVPFASSRHAAGGCRFIVQLPLAISTSSHLLA